MATGTGSGTGSGDVAGIVWWKTIVVPIMMLVQGQVPGRELVSDKNSLLVNCQGRGRLYRHWSEAAKIN